MQYSYKSFHSVPAAAFFCVDPRFWQQTVLFIKQELGFEDFDPYIYPGGGRIFVQDATRDVFLTNLEKVSFGLHHATNVIMIAHRDCGSYGGSKAFGGPEEEKAKQAEDLKLAKNILMEKFPDITVSLYYLEIVGEDKIEFQKIQ